MIAGIEAISEALSGVRVTLDPTERHGFEYQTWLGFSLFADGSAREVGRGGTYTVVHESGAEEAATGFSLFADLGLSFLIQGFVSVMVGGLGGFAGPLASPPWGVRRSRSGGLPEQGEDLLRQLVGLRHHRGAGLLQDLRARQVGGPEHGGLRLRLSRLPYRRP